MVKVDSRYLVLVLVVLMMLIAVLISPVSGKASWTATTVLNSSGRNAPIYITTTEMNLTSANFVHSGAHVDLKMFNTYHTGVYLPQTGCLGIHYCDNYDGTGYCTVLAAADKSAYSGIGEDVVTDRMWTGATYNATAGKYLVVKSYTDSGCTAGGTRIFGISVSNESAVVAPVANFACDNVYSLPDADITCSDLSTNEPTYWRWSVGLNGTDEADWYTVDDVDDLFVWQGSDLGNYTMKLQVSNSAGSDWENKTNYVRLMMFPSWTATPTPSLTAVPWSNITTLNASIYRAQFEDTLIGNLSAPFLDLTETVIGTIETVILSFESIINWPFTLINEQVLGVSNIFGATFAGLLPYTVVPLAITGKVINMIPWQILAIMTLGLLFDTMLLLLKGQ